jgi:signal transduction histidine kinase
MRKWQAIWLVAVLFPLFISAQPQSLQPYLDALDTVRSSTKRVDLLVELSEILQDSDIDRSIDFANQAKMLAMEGDYQLGIANANKWLGMGLSRKGEYIKSLDHLMEALSVYIRLADTLQMADIYNNLGNVYSYHGNDLEAMRYYIIAGDMYSDLKNIKKSAGIQNNVGTLFLTRGQPDTALHYLNRAMLYNLEVKNEDGLATNYSNIGYAFADKRQFEEAIKYYRKTLKIGDRLGNKSNVIVASLNIGDSYMNLQEYDSARVYVAEGIKGAEEEGYKYSQFIGYYTMGEINEQEKNFEEALSWYKKAEVIDKELNNPATQAALMNLQTKQLEKAQENEIARITILSEEKLKSARLKNLLLLVVAASVLLLLLGTSYFLLKRHKSALKISIQNKRISEQKDKIFEQARDISVVNETLKDRNLRLRKLNDEKNYLMNVVAHDLKSPLNQINGLASVIKLNEENLSSDQKECLDNIYVASDRLSKMVDKILNAEAIETEVANVKIEEIDVKALVEETMGNFSGVADKKNITLTTQYDKSKAVISADKQYLRQVFDNLLSNAIKFSPFESAVEIKVESANGAVITEFKDNGPGLTEEDRKGLFQEYAVLSAKPTGDEISTGLGLSIVKKFVDKMGGEVWCDSQPGKGASFKVKFDQI